MRPGRTMFMSLLAAVFACSTPAAAAPLVPDKDPFYRPPERLAAYAPGAIIRSRTVSVQLGQLPFSALGASAYQLLYRTTDPTGHAVANATTLIVPAGKAPSGGRELLSLQDAEDSLTTNCAPSYQLQIGERDNTDLALEVPAVVPAELLAGRDVVIPDVYGPSSEFLVRKMEAHAVLDSVRAVEAFGPAHVAGSRTPVALAGYSGGGHETAAAYELQPAYAPELDLVGVAAGGVPAGDRQSLDYLESGSGSGVVMGLLIALERADARLRWTPMLNSTGRALMARETRGDACVSPVVSDGGRASTWSSVASPLDVPRIARAVRLNSLGRAKPKAPALIYVSQHDELISLPASDRVVAKYCAAGARVQYSRDPLAYQSSPAGDHVTAALAGFIPAALAYLEDRFAGRPAPSSC